jgi:hypothetical protein
LPKDAPNTSATLCEKDRLQEELFLQLKKCDFDLHQEEIHFYNKLRNINSKYIFKISDFKQTDDYEDDEAFHVLLSELEVLEDMYIGLRHVGVLYSC